MTRIGLDLTDLDRRVAEISGGEAVLVALAGLRLTATPITLLDEPTNNLDGDHRRRIAEMISSWVGTLVVVSHDDDLLELMDETAELYDGQLSVFGGPFSAWLAHLDQEQSAAHQARRTARQSVALEKRQRIEAETKLARRRRYADTDYANKRRPKMIMKARAREAQVSAGKLRTEFDDKIDSAEAAYDAASDRIRPDTRIRLDLADPGLASGRRVAELRGTGTETDVVIQGPERLALTGPNGVGKTRLVGRLLDADRTRTAPGGRLLTDRVGYLPQRLALDDDLSVLDAVRQATGATPAAIRAGLAQSLFRGDAVARPVGRLSGGERFRVVLARLLLADPPPQLLVLDEPTNHLDRPSVDQLVDALDAYRGAIIVVSHDARFLSRLTIDRTLRLDVDGRLITC